MKDFLKKYKFNLLVLLLLSLTLPLFFYKLGQSSLVNWDEAWYASISRNILHTGDIFNLKWNGQPYLDHPPFGFWLEALSFKIFGVNEFWARFPQAVAGFLTLFVTYLLGKKLFNSWVGFFSGLFLSSSIWFIYRARSGNLDSLLTLMFVLTFYLSLKSVKNSRWLPWLALSLVGLILTKTVVPLTIFPSLILIFWGQKSYSRFWAYLSIVVILTVAWFGYQYLQHPYLLTQLQDIGLRGVSVKSDYSANFTQIIRYLHDSIGKWYWPGMIGLVLSLILRQKRLLILGVFVIVFMTPFIFSAKGHIWHLIPLHPILILLFLGGTFTCLEKFFPTKRYPLFLGVIIICGYFFIQQTRQNWFNFIDIPRYISDEAILSKEAGKYPQPLFLDGDFDPTGAFYSGKIVKKINSDDLGLIFTEPQPFILITNDWRVDKFKLDPKSYQLIKKDRDKVLLLHP